MSAGTVVVTGARGFGGSHLLDLLREERRRIVAWRSPKLPGHEEENSPDFVWRTVDLLDQDVVSAAVADDRPSEIYHLAGSAAVGSSWSDPVTPLRVNVFGTHHLFTALRLAGLAPRVLIAGSATVYKPSLEPLDESAPLCPTTPYGLSKLAQETLANHAFAVEQVAVLLTRPFNHIGPRQSPDFFLPAFAKQLALIEAGLAEPVLRVGNLEARRDLTDVRDVVQAYRLLMGQGRLGVPYNICSGRAVAIGEVLDRLLTCAGRAIRVEADPARLRPNDNPVVVGSAARLAADVGWSPSWSLDRSVRDVLDWWRLQVQTAPAPSRRP